MISRLFGRRTSADQKNPFSGLSVPPGAGLLTCRVLSPVREPVMQAEFTVTDAEGRKVVSGETDPFGGVTAMVPVGEYRLAISADSYSPYRASASITQDVQLASLGDITLQDAPPQPQPTPGDWEIEPAHSRVGFVARHIGLARVYGRFDNFAGAIRIGESMEDSAMHVVIDAASIDTNVRMRDDHLRSGDFLDVENYPTMEFYSDRFQHRGGDNWLITGALTLHGVTRTVTLDAVYGGVRVGMENETRAAVRATAELHREDYTINWQTMLARGIAAVGSSIKVELEIQIVPKGTELQFK
ncbi:YceI family protein [Streptomyces montanisoli]|uniref:YceI family protein n=1 Tax=Streptomyces montanisoli TaxID=2798581 RepID=A0A940MET2_9ACTN|nr:YceI family protein [Streptomyces montanisoli]MBP0461744.1 YceI family protein [Streptomyces montanisoli]